MCSSSFSANHLLMAFISMVIAFGLVSLASWTIQPDIREGISSAGPANVAIPVLECWESPFSLASLAGTYPALVLSGFKPINTLKGSFSTGSTGSTFRRVSVTIQFALSIILITGTIVIYRQLQLMQSQKLGYDKENLIYLQLTGRFEKFISDDQGRTAS